MVCENQLRYSSIAITVEIYGHRIPGQTRQGLEEALTGEKSHIPHINKNGPSKLLRPLNKKEMVPKARLELAQAYTH